MPTEFVDRLTATRMMAIIRGEDADASVAAALALLDEGFHLLEISLNTANALEVIARVVHEAPEGARIGAGTVLTIDDVKRVRDAGGSFAVTPAVAPSVAESARLGLPVIAGALTPTECVSAMAQGAVAIKLFPASIGGPPYLKALRDPLPGIPFVAVGGVGVKQMVEYFEVGAIAVGLGSPLLGDAAAGGRLTELRDRARRFREAAEPWVEG
ncbi:2-dehydro-3-deoxyphosphogluconate aldolase/(4S)-4-hydroxy-2-oxoglutarate aldolase [Marisediminicola sp. UYEF4]|uniref:bifunctional 4-hydroxy-2-oxoglutarate aldolase/2-dehydro-3-deoxy-phosphogluconate aldolase n=1 Tax=Marisediminicola sp. UYEF4 TaxID=1756384 RepID=UPI00339B2382